MRTTTAARTAVSSTVPEPFATQDESVEPCLWTVEQFQAFSRLGFFGENDHCELIDGIIYKKMPPEPPHSNSVDYTKEAVARAFRSVDCYLRTENPLVTGTDGQPEPDIAVVKHSPRHYNGRFPRADEVLLVVEVTDSTQQHDKVFKRSLYARAGIVEYWIVDLKQRCVLVHRDPQSDGNWSTEFAVPETGSVAPFHVPDAPILVAELLP